MAETEAPVAALNDVTATVGEISTVDPASWNGEVACTTTTIPTSMTEDASASGATDTATPNSAADGMMDASPDAERRRLTPSTTDGACTVTTASCDATNANACTLDADTMAEYAASMPFL